MSNEVQFGNTWRPERGGGNGQSKMAAFIIKYSGGLVANETQASYVGIGLLVVINLITLYFLLGMF
jgi:hypothetical protein